MYMHMIYMYIHIMYMFLSPDREGVVGATALTVSHKEAEILFVG